MLFLLCGRQDGENSFRVRAWVSIDTAVNAQTVVSQGLRAAIALFAIAGAQHANHGKRRRTAERVGGLYIAKCSIRVAHTTADWLAVTTEHAVAASGDAVG